MPRILITTVPFGDKNRYPLDLLEKNNIEFAINPLGKRLTENELVDLVDDFDVIIAGTEPITERVMDHASRLKLICRVGIGLDSVDLLAAQERNILVSYTPEAPSPAVSDLTIGLMYSLLRHVHEANVQLHRGDWHRYFGKRLVNCKVGLIGLGRIGSGVLKHLMALGCYDVLYNDIELKLENQLIHNARFAEKDEIYKKADIVSLHLPLTATTANMITSKELSMMNNDSFLINTSRGGIVNENDLYEALRLNKIAGAAIDVFEREPYDGSLSLLDNCLLTAHMGSMAIDCRTQMEIEATEEAVRFLVDGRQEAAVPSEEYATRVPGVQK